MNTILHPILAFRDTAQTLRTAVCAAEQYSKLRDRNVRGSMLSPSERLLMP
jgi:hypothetical protein